MAARLSAFVIWALVAGSVVFWGLRLLASSPAVPPYAVGVGQATAPPGDIARLLGADAVAGPAAPLPEASRFKLLGVVAPRAGYAESGGVALITVDDRPPRAFRIGAPLVDDWVLQSVTQRTASVGPSQAAAAVVLELPERPAPATGFMPALNGIETGVPRSGGAPQSAVMSSPSAVPVMSAPTPMMITPPPLPDVPSEQPPPPAPDASGGADTGGGPQPGYGPPRRGDPESR